MRRSKRAKKIDPRRSLVVRANFESSSRVLNKLGLNNRETVTLNFRVPLLLCFDKETVLSSDGLILIASSVSVYQSIKKGN